MKGYWAAATGIGLVACLGIGAVGGLDAGGHVSRFYTQPRVHAERPPAVVESAAWDWNESPPQPTSIPASGAVWIGGASERHGDGSDVMEIDRAVERASVRVHRSRPAAPASHAPPDRAEPVPDEPPDERPDIGPTT